MSTLQTVLRISFIFLLTVGMTVGAPPAKKALDFDHGFVAMMGQMKKLKALFADKKLNLEQRTETGDTIFHFAAMGCSVKAIEFLLKQGGKINVRNTSGITPLHTAAAVGGSTCPAAVKYLLSKGANKKAKTTGATLAYPKGTTALGMAKMKLKETEDKKEQKYIQDVIKLLE